MVFEMVADPIVVPNSSTDVMAYGVLVIGVNPSIIRGSNAALTLLSGSATTGSLGALHSGAADIGCIRATTAVLKPSGSVEVHDSDAVVEASMN